jgi:hypothetical protein
MRLIWGCSLGTGTVILVSLVVLGGWGCTAREGGERPREEDLDRLSVRVHEELLDGWGTARGTEVRAGTWDVSLPPSRVTRGEGDRVTFKEYWFHGRRHKVVSFRVTGRDEERPVLFVYGPRHRSAPRKLGVAVGEGSPSVAWLSVRLPVDGEYVVVLGDLHAHVEETSEGAQVEVGRATAYLAAPEETCDCPCENTSCMGDELFENGDPPRKLKQCMQCVDVTEGESPHGECVERTRCFGDEVWEIDSEGNKVRKLTECMGEPCINETGSRGECKSFEEHCGGRSPETCGQPSNVGGVRSHVCGCCGGECVGGTTEGPHDESKGCAGGWQFSCGMEEEEPPPEDEDPPGDDPPPMTTPPSKPAAKVIDCSVKLTEGECAHDYHCGWCPGAERTVHCVEGDMHGPRDGSCPGYRFGGAS